MISTTKLTKIYKNKGQEIKALNNIDLDIKKGEIFGIIGPTGAGKTTLIKILSTIVTPDSGNVVIDTYDVVKQGDEVRKRIGVVVGEFTRALYWRLTAQENMEFFAQIKGIKNAQSEITYLLQLFDLQKSANDPLMKYSTGMKHKLALAIALLNNPPILFLDEPLTGIDPVTAYEIKTLIKKEFNDKTILWTSHNLYEIEEMCKRILLLKNGDAMIQGSVEELQSKYWNYDKIVITCDKPEEFLCIPNAHISDAHKVEIQLQNLNEILRDIVSISKKKQVTLFEITSLKPSLEDIFMAMVNHA